MRTHTPNQQLPASVQGQCGYPKARSAQLPEQNAEQREAEVKEDFSAKRPGGNVDAKQPAGVPALHHHDIRCKYLRCLGKPDSHAVPFYLGCQKLRHSEYQHDKVQRIEAVQTGREETADVDLL